MRKLSDRLSAPTVNASVRAAMLFCAVWLAATVTASLAGCAPATAGKHRFASPLSFDETAAASPDDWQMDDPRRLPMFTSDGMPINWPMLMSAIEQASIIIIGEQHDDAMGHAVELAVVEDVLARWPRLALSMEMLERDHQLLVDDYLDGIIEQRFFTRRTGIARWGGRDGSWDEWFQPIVDTAKDAGSRVIAANAPRRYVRLARTHGYAHLRELPRERRRLFDIPPRLPHGSYRDRFYEVMLAMRDHSDDEDVEEGEENDEDISEREHPSESSEHQHDNDAAIPQEHSNHSPPRPASAPQHPVQDDAIDAMFRSQMLWDATMARSIIRARPSRQSKVVHLVGRFHIDFQGGLLLELRRHRPAARILTITMAALDATELRDEDHDRADIIIYTGEQEEPVVEESEINSAGRSTVVEPGIGQEAKHSERKEETVHSSSE